MTVVSGGAGHPELCDSHFFGSLWLLTLLQLGLRSYDDGAHCKEEEEEVEKEVEGGGGVTGKAIPTLETMLLDSGTTGAAVLPTPGNITRLPLIKHRTS